jgi:hypothetical protein
MNLSFSSFPSPSGPATKTPIKTFETPRFEGDTGVYSYTHYQGCKMMTINGVNYIRDCYGNLKQR